MKGGKGRIKHTWDRAGSPCRGGRPREHSCFSPWALSTGCLDSKREQQKTSQEDETKCFWHLNVTRDTKIQE